MIPPRFEHQEKTYQRQLTTNILFDTSDPGTGKTRVQLDIHLEHRRNGGKCALVLAPKSLVYSAWYDDAQKFTPELKLSVCMAPNREKGFEVEADMYVTNSDAATWLFKQDPSFFERFDTLIVDEATYFKNPDTNRSKALANIRKYFKRRYMLTGTPNPNHITDLWHMVFILDDGERLGESYYAFRNTTCDPIQKQIFDRSSMATRAFKQWAPKPGIEPVVAQLISDINIRHKFKDCVDIPPTHTTHLKYNLNKKAQAEYDQLKKTAVLALDEGYVVGINKAALIAKLFQACSGSVYTESREVGLIDSQRVEMIADLCEERQHSVVFYQWEHQRDALLKKLRARKLSVAVLSGSAKKRQELVQRFQAGMYRVFLAHPQTSGYGLTLTRATATIWASLTWNLEHFIQGNARVPRAGQTKKTEQVIITANGTVEDRVFARLTEKNASQEGILSVLEELS